MSRGIVFPGGLRKVGVENPTYWVEVAVEIENEMKPSTWVPVDNKTLLTWPRMQEVIFAATDVVPKVVVPRDENGRPLKSQQQAWHDLVNALTLEIQEEEAPVEVSESGAIYEAALEFIAGRKLVDSPDAFEQGNRRYETPGGKTAFRAGDLLRHLKQEMGIDDRRRVWSVLEPRGFAGGSGGFVKIGNRSFRAWLVPTENLERWLAETKRGLPLEGVTNGHVTVTEEEWRF